MVKLHKLHKFFGLSAGVILLLLGLSGFFLDHERWSFLYTTTFKSLPQETMKSDARLFNSYWIEPHNPSHIIVSSLRGIYESRDAADSFTKISNLQSLGLRGDEESLFCATSDGVYKYKDGEWYLFALQGEYITSIALSKYHIVAVIDKEELVLLEKKSRKIVRRESVQIASSQLQEDIKLSRFVRDLHYGRGLFDGDISLLLNDYGAFFMIFLPLSGYIIWWYIRSRKNAKNAKRYIKLHANILVIVALFPMVILAVTGIFLDHSQALRKFMSSVTIPHSVLPPIYSKLQSDIWSVDYDGDLIRIGNRYGVYKSRDFKEWQLESRGFAYAMIRKDDKLYVSGMGASNRLYDGEWRVLQNTPHMFKDVLKIDNTIQYFSSHQASLKLPQFKDATLYSLLLTLHDGSFFASWWIWINDFAALALVVLGFTGTYRWYKRKQKRI